MLNRFLRIIAFPLKKITRKIKEQKGRDRRVG